MRSNMGSLLDDLLSKPTAPAVEARKANPSAFTRKVQVGQEKITGEVLLDGDVPIDDTVAELIRGENLNPDEWELVSYNKSEWDSGNGKAESIKFQLRRKANPVTFPLDELLVADK